MARNRRQTHAPARRSGESAAGDVQAGTLQPGDVVEIDGVNGYLVFLAGKVAIQPLADDVRAGLDRRARYVDPSAPVRLLCSAESMRAAGADAGSEVDPLKATG